MEASLDELGAGGAPKSGVRCVPARGNSLLLGPRRSIRVRSPWARGELGPSDAEARVEALRWIGPGERDLAAESGIDAVV